MSIHLSSTNYFSNQLAPTTTRQPCDYEDIQYFIDGYVLHHKSQRHSERTIELYLQRLPKFVWFLQHHKYPTTLADITSNHIRHFLIYLSEKEEGRWDSNNYRANRPMAQATIHAYARALRAFFKWAEKEGGMTRNPFNNVQMPSLPNQWKVETFTDAEIAALFAAADQSGRPFNIQRNRAILALLLDSGIRAAELLALNVSDVNLQDGVFSVTGKGSKTRTVIIGNFARHDLWAYLAHYRRKMQTREAALFLTQSGMPLTYNGLRLVFQKLKKLSGISRVSVRAHVCRHTFASSAHRNGMRGIVLQEILGHASFEVTRKYYLDVSTDDLKRQHSLFGPLDNISKQIKRGAVMSQDTWVCAQSGSGHRPDLPPAEVLAREVAQSNYCAVARRYSVSDVAIRKRLKKAGLVL